MACWSSFISEGQTREKNTPIKSDNDTFTILKIFHFHFILQSWALAVILNVYMLKNAFFACSIPWNWLQEGYFSRSGPEISYFVMRLTWKQLLDLYCRIANQKAQLWVTLISRLSGWVVIVQWFAWFVDSQGGEQPSLRPLTVSLPGWIWPSLHHYTTSQYLTPLNF